MTTDIQWCSKLHNGLPSFVVSLAKKSALGSLCPYDKEDIMSNSEKPQSTKIPPQEYSMTV